MLHVKNEKNKKIPCLIKDCSCHVGLHEMTHDKHKNPKCHIQIKMCRLQGGPKSHIYI
jgi:hypothetical protein